MTSRTPIAVLIALLYIPSLAFLAIAGCARKERQSFSSPLVQGPKAEWGLGQVIDVSGSFSQYITGSDGRAFRAANKIKTDFFRNVEDGRMLLGTISGSTDSLIWNGRAKAYRQK